ncbi:sensor histidine kinase [Marinobacter caseinilyticus]|uniref:sensor histidine kinase n=1 Tax=Marinobacter caseinilyticus TaxID=2692195 RepID=UPI00140A8521|nr:ATP-binding protein [Marinobacter caseinilyticus]
MPLKLAPLNLATVVNEACGNQHYSAIEKDIVIATAIVERAWITADYDQLIQVFQNLLSNAIKFSPRDSVIRVNLSETDRGFRVDIIDQGPGISAEFAGQIFERFAQPDTSTGRTYGGTGLGLHLSRSIIVKLGGRLAYRNEETGCRFYVELPGTGDNVTP